MSSSSLLELVLLRHGTSTYTGIAPDLTEGGIDQVKHVAHEAIFDWLYAKRVHYQNVSIVSSPAPRAIGTAQILIDELFFNQTITLLLEIDAMEHRDKERCKIALSQMKGRGYIDYETEPVFNDASLFETQEEIRERWYESFSSLIGWAQKDKNKKHNIVISHYEVLCHVVHDLFHIPASEETALKNAEPIFISVYAYSDANNVIVNGKFRDTHACANYDLSKHCFVRSS